jgi:tRNA 2-selenouridine synthase
VVDVRSPSEYAEDHVPGAVNLPVLSDEERAEVGLVYARDSFAAKRLGAALVAANIAAHLRGWCATQPRHWRPLLYCWRGGQRSRSFALVLREVGWKATILDGGWRAYRRQVRDDLKSLCAARRFHVLTGLTGVGKTRVLRWLAAQGENVLNLEHLASHRGSLLGTEPDTPQPSQKFFESLVCDALHASDPDRPVWVEAESSRVGRLLVPDPLWRGMMAGSVTEVSAPHDARVDTLIGDYDHFVREPATLLSLLPTLVGRHSKAQVARWAEQIRSGAWREFVGSLLTAHYDPVYRDAVAFPAATRQLVLAAADESGIAAAWGQARA